MTQIGLAYADEQFDQCQQCQQGLKGIRANSPGNTGR